MTYAVCRLAGSAAPPSRSSHGAARRGIEHPRSSRGHADGRRRPCVICTRDAATRAAPVRAGGRGSGWRAAAVDRRARDRGGPARRLRRHLARRADARSDAARAARRAARVPIPRRRRRHDRAESDASRARSSRRSRASPRRRCRCCSPARPAPARKSWRGCSTRGRRGEPKRVRADQLRRDSRTS